MQHTRRHSSSACCCVVASLFACVPRLRPCCVRLYWTASTPQPICAVGALSPCQCSARLHTPPSRSPACSTPIVAVRADVGRLPFATGSVDAIHAGAAIHCWPNPQAAMAEISRVLRPGGVFVASTFLTPLAPLGELLGDATVRPLSQVRRRGGAVRGRRPDCTAQHSRAAGWRGVGVLLGERRISAFVCCCSVGDMACLLRAWSRRCVLHARLFIILLLLLPPDGRPSPLARPGAGAQQPLPPVGGGRAARPGGQRRAGELSAHTPVPLHHARGHEADAAGAAVMAGCVRACMCAWLHGVRCHRDGRSSLCGVGWRAAAIKWLAFCAACTLARATAALSSQHPLRRHCRCRCLPLLCCRCRCRRSTRSSRRATARSGTGRRMS